MRVVSNRKLDMQAIRLWLGTKQIIVSLDLDCCLHARVRDFGLCLSSPSTQRASRSLACREYQPSPGKRQADPSALRAELMGFLLVSLAAGPACAVGGPRATD